AYRVALLVEHLESLPRFCLVLEPEVEPVDARLHDDDAAIALIHPLSLHDALPTSARQNWARSSISPSNSRPPPIRGPRWPGRRRSEEHTSELQSRFDLVCRRLLGKKKQRTARCSLRAGGSRRCGRERRGAWLCLRR